MPWEDETEEEVSSRTPWEDESPVMYSSEHGNPAGEVKASIIGIRSQDLVAMRWYSVYPEKEQAYCIPLAGKLHVVFGAKNVGTKAGNLFGRLLSNSKVLIEGRKQWCAAGAFVYWESDLDMPTEGLKLKAIVGHNTTVDETYEFTILSSAKIPYDYIWEWEGRTNKATFEWTTENGREYGTRPPSDAELIEAAKATYYSVCAGEFVKQCAEQGITVSLVNVLPSAWVEKSDVRIVSQYAVARGERWRRTYRQDVTVHVAGKVYFNSSKDLLASPILPALVIAIGKVIALIIAAILVPFLIYMLFKDMTTTKSEVTKSSKITLPEETHIEKDIKLPDGTVIPACQTLPAGTEIEWKETEKTEAPAAPAYILIVGLVLLGALVLAPRVVMREKE